jgi:translation initiation factor eIF-2B subunit epsilon
LHKTSLLPLERCAVVVVPQEVAETFLRCVKERFAEDNVVIELNALKIAEDRTFADCARYILTTLLALCLPAPAWVSPEYVTLFASDVPDTTAKDGKLQLLGKFKKQMTKWQALLKRFLNSEDDQVQIAEWMMVLVILMELVTMLV